MKPITKKTRNFYVYKHTFPNEKVYIGITCNKPEYRWNNGKGYQNQSVMLRAIKKYGWENIKHEILYYNLNEEEAKQKEVELIKKYKSNQKEYGYNISTGGGGSAGYKMTQEQKQKVSERFKGIPRTEEVKKKISETEKGKIVSQSTREKISKANLGKKISEKQKNQLSKRMIGNTYNCGIQRNKKYAGSVSKKIMCVETGEVFCSIHEASNKLNINRGNLSSSINGRRKTAGGYSWEVIA